jgi:hypothetical protein
MEPFRTGFVYTFERAVFYKLQDAVRTRALDEGAHAWYMHTLTGIDALKDWKSKPRRRSQDPNGMNRVQQEGRGTGARKSKEVVRYADSEPKRALAEEPEVAHESRTSRGRGVPVTARSA